MVAKIILNHGLLFRTRIIRSALSNVMEDKDKMLTKFEASERLGVGISTINKMIAKGLIEVVKYPTGGIRIPSSAVDNLINQSTHKPKEQ